MAFSLRAAIADSHEATGQMPVLEVSDFEFSAFETPNCNRCRLSLNTNVKGLVQWFKYDQIGAACIPRCGSCKCGDCTPGGKFMTLKEEKELDQIKQCLTFKPEGDNHTLSPHWEAKYPYIVSPTQLPRNYNAVKAVLFSSLRRLKRDVEWETIYASQISEMVDRKAAKKLTDEEIKSWDGPVWYVAHQIAPNSMSKTTLCRLV